MREKHNQEEREQYNIERWKKIQADAETEKT
jgi:hypothetical protein